MSIWCSWPGVGYDEMEETQRGEVRTYAEGWSNHYPTTDGAAELPAEVNVAHIAPWCVPGHDECSACHGTQHFGDWLRLTVAAPVSRSWWREDKGEGNGKPMCESVVMDRAAVEALVADLTYWLAGDHVTPTTEGDR